MVAAVDSSEYHPEAFTRRKTFYVKTECQLNPNTNLRYGKMFVEHLEPLLKRQQYPIILIHGDYHTGQIWLTKPDGQPGWATCLLHAGYQVYLVDLPPTGRSDLISSENFSKIAPANNLLTSKVEQELTAPEKTNLGEDESFGWPSAPLHNKWPGTGERGDPIFERLFTSLGPLRLRSEERQRLAQVALQNLLKITGKAILLGHGSGATMAWLAADIEPSLVAGVIALEPAGPPFGVSYTVVSECRKYTDVVQKRLECRIYGLADIPLTYYPPARLARFSGSKLKSSPLDLDLCMDNGSGAAYIMQRCGQVDNVGNVEVKPLTQLKESAATCQPRQLINLQKMPHAVFTAQASAHSVFDWQTVMFMSQAGLKIEWLQLEHHNIFGNGHLMFLETNSDEIANLLMEWIQRSVEGCRSPTSTFTLTNEEIAFDGSLFQNIDSPGDCGQEVPELKQKDIKSPDTPDFIPREPQEIITPNCSVESPASPPEKQRNPGRFQAVGQPHSTVYDTPTPPQFIGRGYRTAASRAVSDVPTRGQTKFSDSPWRRDQRFRAKHSRHGRNRFNDEHEGNRSGYTATSGSFLHPYPSPPYTNDCYIASPPPVAPPAWFAYHRAMTDYAQAMAGIHGQRDNPTDPTEQNCSRNITQLGHQMRTQNYDPFVASYASE